MHVECLLLAYGTFLKDHTYFRYVNMAENVCGVRLQIAH